MSLPVIPKKSLGQNFLNSKRVIERIGQIVIEHPTDCVLEIGPGLGFLTKQLITTTQKLIAVEKDTELFSILENEFHQEIQDGKITLFQEDILKFDPQMIKKFGSDYQIAANIPYNITGLIFRKFFSTPFPPKHMTVLIQKEVATRILAKDKKESLLSLSIKAYGKPKLITHVSRGNFTPPPNVDSSIISIFDISRKNFINQTHEEHFFTLIHAGFAHKRKLLIKNLVDENIQTREFWEQAFEKENILHTIRAEDLNLEQWLNLATYLLKK